MNLTNKPYEVDEWITRWGNPASIALMDPACEIFSTPEVDGIIGYRFEANNVIVFGDPLCHPDDTGKLNSLFHEHFNEKSNNIIYLATTEEFTRESLKDNCTAAIGIGREITLDPMKDPRQESGNRASLLRRNCKHAVRDGVIVRELQEKNTDIEQAIVSLGESWVKGRQGPQVYLQNVNIFAHREHRRYFYAELKGKIVGVLILNRLDAYRGWVISFAMTCPEAPLGTSDFLIVSALEALGEEQCRFFAIGTVPIPEIEEIHGLTDLTSWCVRHVYSAAMNIFHLKDRERYWQKFAPSSQSTYLLLSKPQIGVDGVMGIMSALNATKK
jgi:lysylphosphatidylglycerol synthetase-like protein (DUF2156 family)